MENENVIMDKLEEIYNNQFSQYESGSYMCYVDGDTGPEYEDKM